MGVQQSPPPSPGFNLLRSFDDAICTTRISLCLRAGTAPDYILYFQIPAKGESPESFRQSGTAGQVVADDQYRPSEVESGTDGMQYDLLFGGAGQTAIRH